MSGLLPLPQGRMRIAATGLLTYASLFGLLSGCNRTQEAPVQTAQVARRDIVGIVALNGEAIVPPDRQATVLPPYRTTVAKVYTGVGQSVKKGDVLLEMSAPQAQAAYQQNRQTVKASERTLEKVDEQYSQAVQRAQDRLQKARQREKQLREQAQKQIAAAGNSPNDIGPATEAVSAGLELEQAVAERKAAEQALQQAQRERQAALEPYKQQTEEAKAAFSGAQGARKAAAIRAPISGEVIQFEAVENGTIGENASAPIAVIVDLDDVKVHAPLTPELAPYVKEDLPVTMAFPKIPDVTFEGRVEDISKETANQSPNPLAVIEFKNEKGLVKPGMEGRVTVRIGEQKNVLVVPNGAVSRNNAGQPIVRVNRNGKWDPVVVQLGLSDGQYTEIKSGLEEGETVQVGASPS